uniref:Reprolysin n=1 Tax=Rhipicephalus zambeziensis TaxID=60191 RepID=A0A224YPX2_9ACAR
MRTDFQSTNTSTYMICRRTCTATKKQFAAVMLYEEDGALNVEGVVGPNLKIRPIESSERSEDGRQAHLVENIEDNDSLEVHGKLIAHKTDIAERSASQRTDFDSTKYNVQEIFPELLLICDSRLQVQFTRRMNLTAYMIITMEVVNMRYSALSNPRVRILLRGMELSKWPQEHEYYVYSGGNTIDAYKSLQNLVKFVSKYSDKYKSFDMVYFATGFDMVSIYDDGTRMQALQGYAFVASACTGHRQQLGEDQAYTFQGIRIMTHEVAHTLGCSHDGTTAPGVVKAFTPNSVHCPWGHGYIMSYLQDDIRSMQFSSCCKYDIQRLSWSFEAGCLHTNNSETYPLDWITRYQLPGEFLSLNRQCHLRYPFLSRTYFIEQWSKWNCRGQCFVPGVDYHHPADGQWDLLFLDGTTCSHRPKRICINGLCRPDPRTEIPQRPY